jgi:hypothetical protein
MRLVAAIAVLATPAFTFAQPVSPITAAPIMPPSAQTPAAAQPRTDQPQPAPPPDAPQPIPLTWVPQGTAQLQVLDKVNAQSAVLTVKVGQEAQFGSLSIQVQACNIHPPDQPQDSAAYLNITDSHADAPGFRGWMLANNPALSMMQHPLYDVRVMGCRA